MKKTHAEHPIDNHKEMRIASIEHQVAIMLGNLNVSEREGMQDTPKRVAKMYVNELFAGIGQDYSKILERTFEVEYSELILVKDIPFYSMCEHHLIPFFGVAHVGYIPHKGGRVVGLSKIARLVEMIAAQPQVQERLTTQIADCIQDTLSPQGVMVMIKAEHLCMTMRGIRKPGAQTITSVVRGVFRDPKECARQEFLACLQSV